MFVSSEFDTRSGQINDYKTGFIGMLDSSGFDTRSDQTNDYNTDICSYVRLD